MKQLRYEAACLLVDGALWEQYLQKNGPKIDKAEVNKRFAELEEAVKKAGKSMAEYYKDTGQTEAASAPASSRSSSGTPSPTPRSATPR